MEAKVVWKDEMGFEAHLDSFNFMIDAYPEVGGKERGPRPKGLTLISLAGCTGMDVISILKKSRHWSTIPSISVNNADAWLTTRRISVSLWI